MSLDKIKHLVSLITKAAEDNEELSTQILSMKLTKCLETYPEDKTIGAMSVIIDKMANKPFIRKADLKRLYSQLYSENTRFAELFSDELGAVEELQGPTFAQRDDSKSLDYKAGDSILSNALNSIFDKSNFKSYSQPLANKAQTAVANRLDCWNLKPSSIAVDDGNDKFLVVKANYETPKGITSFYVPIEILNGKVSEASIFMGNCGPQSLDNTNVKNYLKQNCGVKLKVTGTGILGALSKAASENREISDAELAVIRLNSSREQKSHFFDNQIVGLKLAEEGKKDVELKSEFKSFEDQFSSVAGQAEFAFGKEKIKIAKDYIARELKDFGFKNNQIVVISNDESTIFYGVSLDSGQVAFTVPVKVSNGKLQAPNVLVCNGSVSSFDKDGINQLYIENKSDHKVAALGSPLFSLKSSDLINSIREFVSLGDHARAEDALNVLANSGDVKAYASGFNAFVGGLGMKKEASTKCSKMIKNSTSKHEICSHTGLPVNKVYQDKYGNCLPLYRRAMSETYEGATFMNAKIFG